MVALSAFDRDNLELDVLGHPLLNVVYYSLVELLPTACVLYILRKLPPKRAAQQGYSTIGGGAYQRLPDQDQYQDAAQAQQGARA